MLKVLERSGFPMQKEFSEGLVHVTLALAGDKA